MSGIKYRDSNKGNYDRRKQNMGKEASGRRYSNKGANRGGIVANVLGMADCQRTAPTKQLTAKSLDTEQKKVKGTIRILVSRIVR
jgi:hypothetical protein